MQTGLILLALAYVLSQFFRAFLAVLTGPLETELGITPDVLATASGYWFLAFALMQLPVGKALDTLGPRRTGGWLFLIGGAGGAALFAVAQGPLYIHAAMALIGIGCSPVLMASFYIFAREFDPARFATLAALMIGIGTIGNLISSYPMAFAVDTMGWRLSMWALAAITAVVAIGVLLSVRDPAKVEAAGEGSLFDLLRMPVLWFIIPIMFVNYAPVAAVRGLWIGAVSARCLRSDDSADRDCYSCHEPRHDPGHHRIWPARPNLWHAQVGCLCRKCADGRDIGHRDLLDRRRSVDLDHPVCCHRGTWRVLSRHHCARAQLLSSAPHRARSHFDEPLWNRRGRRHANHFGSNPHSHDGRRPHRSLRLDFRVFCHRAHNRCGDLCTKP